MVHNPTLIIKGGAVLCLLSFAIMDLMSRRRRFVIRFLEFFVIGVGLGLVEDLIAIHFATGASLDARTVWIAFFVAFPFAAFTELVVDHPGFWKKLIPTKGDPEDAE